MQTNPAAITAARLRELAPRCDYMAIAPHLDRAAKRYGIDTPRRVGHWLATVYVETQAFTRLEENLNYSAERLCEVWPGRFPTLASAAPYARNPRALANKVYGGRYGNTGPDDGWLYRGGGGIHLTFRDNYAAASKWTGLDLVRRPDLVRSWEVGAVVAAAFWETHGLNEIVAPDPGERIYATLDQTIRANEEDDLRQARKVVQGGQLGVDDVRRALLRSRMIWRGTDA